MFPCVFFLRALVLVECVWCCIVSLPPRSSVVFWRSSPVSRGMICIITTVCWFLCSMFTLHACWGNVFLTQFPFLIGRDIIYLSPRFPIWAYPCFSVRPVFFGLDLLFSICSWVSFLFVQRFFRLFPFPGSVCLEMVSIPIILCIVGSFCVLLVPSCPLASAHHIAMWVFGTVDIVSCASAQCCCFSLLVYRLCGAYVASIVIRIVAVWEVRAFGGTTWSILAMLSMCRCISHSLVWAPLLCIVHVLSFSGFLLYWSCWWCDYSIFISHVVCVVVYMCFLYFFFVDLIL